MNNRGMSVFCDRFAEVAADSDYSRIPKLQDVSQYDIRAAAKALWRRAIKVGLNPESVKETLNEADVIWALEAKVKSYQDDNELVSVEFEKYWDATDGMKFSASLLLDMEYELSNRFQAQMRKEGFVVIDDIHGIWLFKFEDTKK